MSLSSQVQPVTLHGQHRPYSDPAESELFVTFREPHRVRYTKADGTVVHDEVIDVQYEFTSLDGSMGFQGDFRRQDLIDYFDVDVVCMCPKLQCAGSLTISFAWNMFSPSKDMRGAFRRVCLLTRI